MKKLAICLAVLIAAACLALLVRRGRHESSPGGALKVRLAVNPVPLGALPIIAEKAGYWKDAGLQAGVISFPTG